jgi:UDP-N-acetylmuramoylalanine--D-glutamate ligase
VAITGSNGKTTTTSLIGALLRDGGIPTQIGGNIGTPLINLVGTAREDGWTVAELSSFQLEAVDRFHANVAIALNVTPNHMDRYDLLSDYAAAKHRIFRNQEPSDVAVLNADDPIVASWAGGLRAHVVLISTRRELQEGLFLRGRDLVSRTAQGERVLTNRDEMQLQGLHNAENVLAALAAGLACGVGPDAMRETIRGFRPVEHRLEHAGMVDGVDFFNDSKATSVDAAVKAMEALSDRPGKVVLILGGLGKKAPYAPLADLIARYARRMILIGDDAPVIERELGSSGEFERATDMNDAVQRAFAAAQTGDAVLLAPACASFDMFRSFEHRGEVFKQSVRDLSETKAGSGHSA